jgi:hypothetical protein
MKNCARCLPVKVKGYREINDGDEDYVVCKRCYYEMYIENSEMVTEEELKEYEDIIKEKNKEILQNETRNTKIN